MNKKITPSVLFASLLCLASFACLPVGRVSAQTIPNPLKYNNFSDLITNGIIPAVAGVVGSLATIMIIVAGILYLTSAGSPEKIKTAKTAFIYAIIGIVIALAASAIASIIKGVIGA